MTIVYAKTVQMGADSVKRHSLFSGERPSKWYSQSLFKPNRNRILWPDGKPKEIFPEGASPNITYSNLLAVFDSTQARMVGQVEILDDAIFHTRLNSRVGFCLVDGGRYQDQIKKAKRRKEIATWLLPNDHMVSRRILYRLVRGFFMIPVQLASELEIDPGSTLSRADSHIPKNWSCFGEGAAYLERLRDAPSGLLEQDEWLQQQRRAVAVFRAFCGKLADPTARRAYQIGGEAYGDTFEMFRKAVYEYYLVPNCYVNICEPPELFPKYDRSPTEASDATLDRVLYEIEGQGESSFHAALWGCFDRSSGKFELRGSFCPASHDPPIEFTRLDIHVSRPDDQKILVQGLSRLEERSLPEGCRPYRTVDTYSMRLKGETTEEIDNLLYSGFHLMTLRNATKPFVVRYRATAPLANIRTGAEFETTNPNTPRTTASEVVVGYLKSIIAPMQAGWTPPPDIPVIKYGTMVFCDASIGKGANDDDGTPPQR